jgi:hypothetical protein
VLLTPVLAVVYSGGWEERLDWTLLLERESFFAPCAAAFAFAVPALLRILPGRFSDKRLKIPRFPLRTQFMRARATFLHAREMK